MGSPYLELPPGREAVVQPGGCNSYCTEKVFRQKIYIVKVLPHMHHMGESDINCITTGYKTTSLNNLL